MTFLPPRNSRASRLAFFLSLVTLSTALGANAVASPVDSARDSDGTAEASTGGDHDGAGDDTRTAAELLAAAEFELRALGDAAGAVELFRQAIAAGDARPGIEARLRFGLADALAALGKNEEARTVLDELAERQPRLRDQVDRQLAEIASRSGSTSPAGIEDWFAGLRADAGLQAELVRLVTSLAAGDEATVRATLEHLSAMGVLAAPIAETIARVTGDGELRARVAALLLARGDAEWLDDVLESRRALERFVRTLDGATSEVRGRLARALERGEPGLAEPAAPALLRLIAGDLTSGAADVALVIEERPVSDAALRIALDGVARSEDGRKALWIVFDRRGAGSPPMLIDTLVAVEPVASRVALALEARGVQWTPGMPRNATTPSWIRNIFEAVLTREPAFQAAFARAVASDLLPLLLSPKGEVSRRSRIDNEVAASSVVVRIIAERTPDVSVRGLAEALLIDRANADAREVLRSRRPGSEGTALAELEPYLDSDAEFILDRALLPATVSRLELLVDALEHDDITVRDWATRCLSLVQATPVASRPQAPAPARGSFQVLYPSGGSFTVAFPPEQVERVATALWQTSRRDYLAAKRHWAVLDLPPNDAARGDGLATELLERVERMGHRRTSGVWNEHPGDTIWLAHASEALREQVLAACVEDFRRLAEPLAGILELPQPPVRLEASFLLHVASAAARDDLWKVVEIPGGATLLLSTLRAAEAIQEMPAPGSSTWSPEDRDALERLVDRCLDSTAPVAHREEILRLLAAYFAANGDEQATRRLRRDPRRYRPRRGRRDVPVAPQLLEPYREKLRPAIADEALSPGHRALALAVASGQALFQSGSAPQFPESPERRSRQDVWWHGPIHSDRLISRFPAGSSTRRSLRSRSTGDENLLSSDPIPEARGFIGALEARDPILSLHAEELAAILVATVPEDAASELARSLSRSPIAYLRAFAASLDGWSAGRIPYPRHGYTKRTVSSSSANGDEDGTTGVTEDRELAPLPFAFHREIARGLAGDATRAVRDEARATLFALGDLEGLLHALLAATSDAEAYETAVLLEKLESAATGEVTEKEVENGMETDPDPESSTEAEQGTKP